MLHDALTWAEPIISELLVYLIGAFLLWISRFVPTGIKAHIDRVRQESLHRAVRTGVSLGIGALGSAANSIGPVAAVNIALTHVVDSSPGILKWFFKKNAAAAQAHVLKLIRAELAERGRVDVIEATEAAGGGWVGPQVPTK